MKCDICEVSQVKCLVLQLHFTYLYFINKLIIWNWSCRHHFYTNLLVKHQILFAMVAKKTYAHWYALDAPKRTTAGKHARWQLGPFIVKIAKRHVNTHTSGTTQWWNLRMFLQLPVRALFSYKWFIKSDPNLLVIDMQRGPDQPLEPPPEFDQVSPFWE